MNEITPALLLSILSLVLYGFTLLRSREMNKRLDRHLSMVDACAKLCKLTYNRSIRVEALMSESQSLTEADTDTEEGVDEELNDEQREDQPDETVRPRFRRSYS